MFFPNGIATEISCELDDKLTCNTDMLSFKGYVTRWLAVVAQLVPQTRQTIVDVMRTSAAAAVKQCTGSGPPGYGRTCGMRWNRDGYDGTFGAGQQMNVLAAMTSLLFIESAGPITNTTGGTSPGDYNAGSGPAFDPPRPITQADRAGAGIITALVLVMATSTFAWMSTNFFEKDFTL